MMDTENHTVLNDFPQKTEIRWPEHVRFSEDFINFVKASVKLDNPADYQYSVNKIIEILKNAKQMKNEMNMMRKCYTEKIKVLMDHLKRILDHEGIMSFPLTLMNTSYQVSMTQESDFDILDQIKKRSKQKKTERHELDLPIPQELAETVIDQMTTDACIGNDCKRVDREPKYDYMNRIIRNNGFCYAKVIKKKKNMSLKKMDEFIHDRGLPTMLMQYEQMPADMVIDSDEENTEAETRKKIQGFFQYFKKEYEDYSECGYDLQLSSYNTTEEDIYNGKNIDKNANMQLYAEVAPIIDAIFILKKKTQMLKKFKEFSSIKVNNLPLYPCVIKYLTESEYKPSASYIKSQAEITNDEYLNKQFMERLAYEITLVVHLKHNEPDLSLPYYIQGEEGTLKLYTNYSFPALDEKYISECFFGIMVERNLKFNIENIKLIMDQVIKTLPTVKKVDAKKSYRITLTGSNHFDVIKYRHDVEQMYET